MATDGVVSTLEEGLQILELNPDAPLPRASQGNGGDGDSSLVAVNGHPTYQKYFSMLSDGLPKETVQAKIVQEVLDASVLDKKPDDKVPVNVNVNVKKETDAKTEKAEEVVPLKDHPKYAKYFKMLKVGLPKEAVKAKMQQEGVDPSIIDQNADDTDRYQELNKCKAINCATS